MFKLYYAFTALFFVSCAIVSSPEGGEKDLIAPEVVKTVPENKSVNFSQNTIEIEFSEYIELQNFGTQFYSSPPLTKKITQKLKGKKLTLTLDEELLPNTTYTFNFGNSITDITERNVQGNFKYVFSTGSFLDSLAIKGKVVDAFTGLPEEGVIAMLYAYNLADSAVLSQKPVYYAITTKEGTFSIDNLALDTFQVLAVKDLNFDLIYTPGAEKYAFAEHNLIAGTPENVLMRSFFEAGDLKLLEIGQKAYGKLALGFNKPPTNLTIDIAASEVSSTIPTQNYIEGDLNGDTLYYWYNPKQYPEDINFLFLNVAADSLQTDSVRVLLTKATQAKLNVAPASPGKIDPIKPLVLESTMPITTWQKDSIVLYKDSTSIPFEMTKISGRHFELAFERRYGENFTLIARPGAFIDLFDTKNDSISLKAAVANEEDLAILQLKLSSIDTEDKLIQLFDLKGKTTIEERVFTNRLEFELRNLQPGSYGIRIIWDENKNGIWDAGEFTGRKQPERVMYYPKPIELRANWELETVWEIPLE